MFVDVLNAFFLCQWYSWVSCTMSSQRNANSSSNSVRLFGSLLSSPSSLFFR